MAKSVRKEKCEEEKQKESERERERETNGKVECIREKKVRKSRSGIERVQMKVCNSQID